MSQPPRTTRRYDSSRRREQAAATRREILDAAERLFARDGYRPTTMAALAAEAGVAAKTVYVAFETKSGVLRALWNARLRGDEGEAPVAERAWYREVLDETDPVRRLRLNARNSRAAKVRLGPVLDLIRDAAPADRDIAELWDAHRGRSTATTSAPCSRPCTRRAPSARASTWTAPPTSSGRSTTRASGGCWWAPRAGRPRTTRSGARRSLCAQLLRP